VATKIRGRIRQNDKAGQLAWAGFVHPVGRYTANNTLGHLCVWSFVAVAACLFVGVWIAAHSRDASALTWAFGLAAIFAALGFAVWRTPPSRLYTDRGVLFGRGGRTMETPRRSGSVRRSNGRTPTSITAKSSISRFGTTPRPTPF